MPENTTFPLQSTAQFAQYLRALRRSRGLTQRELGQKIGVTGARISEIEKDPAGVGLSQILKLLHVLGARAVLQLRDDTVKSVRTNAMTPGEW